MISATRCLLLAFLLASALPAADAAGTGPTAPAPPLLMLGVHWGPVAPELPPNRRSPLGAANGAMINDGKFSGAVAWAIEGSQVCYRIDSFDDLAQRLSHLDRDCISPDGGVLFHVRLPSGKDTIIDLPSGDADAASVTPVAQ